MDSTADYFRSSRSKSTSQDRWIVFWENTEFYRFSLIIIVMAFVGCLGGIAAAYALENSTTMMAMVVFPTMISLAMVLAVLPMRVIFGTAAVAVLIDLVIIIIHAI